MQARNPAGEYFPAGFVQETLPKPFAFSKNIPTFVVNRLTGPDYGGTISAILLGVVLSTVLSVIGYIISKR